jgi:hypothetical protein
MAEKKTTAGMPRMFVQRLSMGVAMVTVLLVLGECASYFWLLHSVRRTARITAHSASSGASWAAQYATESSASDRMQYKPYVVWRHAAFSGETINVDSDGIRKTSYSSCENGSPVIWMFGDAALWGAGAPDGETIPSFLAKRYADSGRTPCVRNFGEKGWVSTQETIQFILALKQASVKPDLVIFYDGVSDSAVPFPSYVADAHANFDATKTIFEAGPSEHRAGFSYLKHSNTYHVLGLLQRSHRTSSSTAHHPTPDEIAARILDNYQKNMDLVEALGQHYGVRSLFVWQPVLLVGDKTPSLEETAMLKAAESELHPGSTALMRATYEDARKITRPDFLYLGDVFAHEHRSMYGDVGQANPEGNRVIAGKMFEFSQQRKAPSH